MAKVRCKECAYYDEDTGKCLIKKIGGGKKPKVAPNKSRKCDYYKSI